MNIGGQISRSVGGVTPASRTHTPTPHIPPSPVSRTPTPQLESLRTSDILTPLQKIYIDKNKLLSSVYSKQCNDQTTKYRYVLKYSDGGIKRPKTQTDMVVSKPSKGFPKLVSRFVSKQEKKGDLMVSIESYRMPGQKMSVISHSFCS